MFSECLSSLRAAAKAGENKDVRLLALKTLGEVEWKHYFGDIESAPDLPSDIDAILDSACPFWPEKQVKDTHLLVLMPATVDGKPFTLNLLQELIECSKSGGHGAQYSWYASGVREQFGAVSPAASYWLLMTRDVLPESRRKTYAAQQKLIVDHARDTRLPYELPKVLEAATAILTHYVRNGERLYSDSPWTYTRCQELILYESEEDPDESGKYPAVVGGFFESSGLCVSHDGHYYAHDCDGVAGCRKFF
jgi:NLR family CARD domain-containing protein 3